MAETLRRSIGTCREQAGKTLVSAILMFAAIAVTGQVVFAQDALVGRASVIDGDTVEIRGQRIRLHAIDAPESGQACRDPQGQMWPCGRRAAFALAEQIGTGNVSCRATDQDRYGRPVAVCSAGDRDLNAWMVEQGWAMAYRQYGTDYVEQEAVAEREKRGIWAGEFVPPWAYRRGERLPGEGQSSARSAVSDTAPVARRPAPSVSQPAPSPAACGTKTKCGQMADCAEARFFLEQCGVQRLDGDGDGVPCERICR